MSIREQSIGQINQAGKVGAQDSSLFVIDKYEDIDTLAMLYESVQASGARWAKLFAMATQVVVSLVALAVSLLAAGAAVLRCDAAKSVLQQGEGGSGGRAVS